MERIEGSELQIGYCNACGQARQFQTSGGVMQEHLNEWATEECKCAAGEYDRKMKKSYEKAVKNIEKLFDNDFPETAEILKTALPFIMKDDIAGITIKTGHEVDAKLSMTSKGKVKVEKKNNKKISITE